MIKDEIQPTPSIYANLVYTFFIPTMHLDSFAHPMQYFAAAGENYDFVIAVINFPLNQC